MQRRTVIVQGSLAYRMRRAIAAREHDTGLQILNLGQLAARLAGGFLGLATSEHIEPAIRIALGEGGFQDLEDIKSLPGMTRAIAKTLRKAWYSDLRLTARAGATPRRIDDLVLIEGRIKNQLPSAALLPADLRDAALARIRLAPILLGPIVVEGAHFVEPVWRDLLNALCDAVTVEWLAPPIADTAWFRGRVNRATPASAEATLVTCADPRHEALEALRWARSLLASGAANASEIGICGVSTEEWDDHIFSLAAASHLRVHFSHGVPCLSTREGQRCAALADVLLNGLSQARVRRLFSLASGEGTVLDALPHGWLSVARGVNLVSLAEWSRVLRSESVNDTEAEAIVLPLLTILEKGSDAAKEAASAFLRGRSRRLWDMATRAAPGAALELTLKTIRIPDERDPCDSVAWCPAWQLAAAPRPWVRLLGLTSRGWPRRFGEDPILPSHIAPAADLDTDPPAEADRRAFQNICALAERGIVFSRSRRNVQGALIGPSPLLPSGEDEKVLARGRMPEHSLTESDRLGARPQEAAETPLIDSATHCWRDWHVSGVTAHDGILQSGHAVISNTIARLQSPTSLTRMLRDPLGFVWRYALGWQVQSQRERPLTLPPEEFGRLVHELLRRTVDALEPKPGFTVARVDEIEAALADAVAIVMETWPVERPVPPHVLWVNTVRQAAEISLVGLCLEQFTEAGTRSWTEVGFGQAENDKGDNRDLPWKPSASVAIPGTPVTIRGNIDRVDLRASGQFVRVTDYKTGERPKAPASVVVGGGAELQRVLYALACRQLLEDSPQIVARLIYLKDKPAIFKLADLDSTFELVSKFVAAACAVLESGKAIPGVGSEAKTNDLRLALPASPGYFRRKQTAFRAAAGDLTQFWRAK